MMIRLHDVEQGSVAADGTSHQDAYGPVIGNVWKMLLKAKAIMEASGVTGPFVDGMVQVATSADRSTYKR